MSKRKQSPRTKPKSSPKGAKQAQLRELTVARAKKGQPKAPRPARPSRGAQAPASIATVAPVRFIRDISLERVIKRRDMGDITGLAKSIDDRGGLISPVCIDPSNYLIAGQRRLAAWAISRFAKEPIPVNVLDVDIILAGEFDENAKRKDFTPSESVELMEALAPKLQEQARARQKLGRGKKADEGTAGAASDHLARYLGRDRKTLDRAKAVVEASRAEPKNEEITKLVTYMDKTGKVNGPWKRLQSLTQKAEIEEKKATGKLDLPTGKFDRIVADMPWAFEPDDDKPKSDTRGMRPYATMSHKAMCAMAPDIMARLADNVVVFFWVPNFHMPYAYHVLQAWGFKKFPTILTWKKDKIGRGHWLRDQTEHCIIAVKGKPAWHLDSQSTVFDGPRRENSRKPDEFYALIDQLAPAQRSLELFARRELPEGWEGFGDQVGTLKGDKPPDDRHPGTQMDIEEAIASKAEIAAPIEAAPEMMELEALTSIDNERAVPEAALAKLKADKLVRGSVKPKLTKAGIARLGELRRAEAHDSIEREGVPQADPSMTDDGSRDHSASGEPNQPDNRPNAHSEIEGGTEVDCRVCGDGGGLCAQCLDAEPHTIEMTTLGGAGETQSIASCQCRDWVSRLPWGARASGEQDAAIKAHWQDVVANARDDGDGIPQAQVTEESCPGHVASENDPKVCGHCGVHIDGLRPPDDDGLGIPAFLQRQPAEAAE